MPRKRQLGHEPSMTAVLTAPDTSGRILDVAERLVQTRGFNAFSYADIAAELNITKAALHYHFASKAILGERLVDRYRENFLSALNRIDEQFPDTRSRARAYVAIYTSVVAQQRMCLCGILAAEFMTLGQRMQARVQRFFEDNESWVSELLASGRARGELRYDGAPAQAARFLIEALEGGMLLACAFGGVARFNATAAHALRGIGVI